MPQVTFGPNARALPVKTLERSLNPEAARKPERGPNGQINDEYEWRWRNEGFEGLGLQQGQWLKDYARVRASDLIWGNSKLGPYLTVPLLITSQQIALDVSASKAGNRRAHMYSHNGRHFIGIEQKLYRDTSTTDPAIEDSGYAPASDIICLTPIVTASGYELFIGLAGGTSAILSGPTAATATVTAVDAALDPAWGSVPLRNESINVVYANGFLYSFPFTAARGEAVDEDTTGGIAETAVNRLLRTDFKDTGLALTNARFDEYSFSVANGGFAVGELNGAAWFVVPEAADATGITVPRRLIRVYNIAINLSATSFYRTGDVDYIPLGMNIQHATIFGRSIAVADTKRVLLYSPSGGQIQDTNIFGGHGPVAARTIAGLWGDNWPELIALVEIAGTSAQLWRFFDGHWSPLTETISMAAACLYPAGQGVSEGNRRIYVLSPNTTNVDIDRQQVLYANTNPLEEVAAAGFAVDSDGTYKVLVTPDLVFPQAVKTTCIGGIFYGSQDWPPTSTSDVRIRLSDDGGANWNTVTAAGGLVAAGPTVMSPTPFAIDYQVRMEIGINNVSGAPASALSFELWFVPQWSDKEIWVLEVDAKTVNDRGEWETLKAEIESEVTTTPSSTMQSGEKTIRARWYVEYKESVEDPADVAPKRLESLTMTGYEL